MIKFKDLSGWLKLAIIGGWICSFTYIIAFIYGFLIGLSI